MSIFCTRCGTSNGDDDAFCENCGAPLRRPSAPVAIDNVVSPGNVSTSTSARNLGLYAGIGIAGLAIVAGVAYFMTRPPRASAENLLAAASHDLAAKLTGPVASSLCLSNMDYAANPFNVADYDSSTLQWLDMLASAGLYQKVGTVVGGNVFFQQNLIQYKQTPAIERWRQGNRLCVAHHLSIHEVTDIGQTHDYRGTTGTASRHTVDAVVVTRTDDLADWVLKPGVQEKLIPELQGWTLEQNQLKASERTGFVVKDGQWHVDNGVYQDRSPVATSQQNGAGTSEVSLWSRIKSLFMGRSHRLEGTWQIDADAFRRATGLPVPDDIGSDQRLTFSADTCEIKGAVEKCTFEADGNKVKVFSPNEKSVMVFEFQDDNTVQLNLGLFPLTYKRVR
ncbi:MAG: zinc-ribbon domain-containing protein [Burkholderiales bacterium]|nr:zinc-ribbon domain-containing protein [Burkholderiales bacterium]